MAKNIAAVLAVVFFVAWASLVTWKAAVPGSQAGPPGKFGSVLGGGANPTGMNPLCTTGLTEASGIVCKTSGAHVRSCELFNNTTASAYAVLADSPTIPTTFAPQVNATGPGMIGTPHLVPAGSEIVLGTDYFGTDGILTTTGFSVGISTNPTQPDAGTDAGFFLAAGPFYDITCNGQ